MWCLCAQIVREILRMTTREFSFRKEQRQCGCNSTIDGLANSLPKMNHTDMDRDVSTSFLLKRLNLLRSPFRSLHGEGPTSIDTEEWILSRTKPFPSSTNLLHQSLCPFPCEKLTTTSKSQDSTTIPFKRTKGPYTWNGSTTLSPSQRVFFTPPFRNERIRYCL